MSSSSLRALAGVVLAVLAVSTWAAVGNLIPKEERLQSSFWRDDGIRLGLDLRGGIHWVVGVQLDQAIERELEYVRDRVTEALGEDHVSVGATAVANGVLTIGVPAGSDAARIRDAADETNILAETSASNDTTLAFSLTDDWKEQIEERTMSQVLEVLRRRIDDPEKGVPDSVVTRQGADRVLIQIPGEQLDRDQLRDLVNATGFLEFKIVDAMSPSKEQLLAALPGGQVPAGKMIVTQRDSETEAVVNYFLVPETPAITGDYLADARVQYDQQNRPYVGFTWNPEGGAIFGELTGKNIRRNLAVILDGNVYSAPTIQSQIFSRGQITGRFTPEEASTLAVVLRAGSLSVPVVIEEERTVGPALGQDSIDRGTNASVVGLVLVVLFTAIYYRMSGVYAAIALLGNLILLLAVMTLFGATLTMPGIAGLVLTVGMAVDANVIIFERIREELRGGKTPRAAIATGFNKATWTVLDANITTWLTAIILYSFGTGPIKGFAVTLSIGIFTSVAAALVLTRVLFQIHPGVRNVKTLSI